VSTCYLFYDAELLSRMARVLGSDAQADQLGREASAIRDAFHSRFWDRSAQRYGTGSQACQAIPLALGLVPDEVVASVMECLVRDICDRGTHLSTGNLATRYVLEVLAEHGHIDLAWALVTQRSYPSWGYMIDHGATTIWERWEHIRGGGMSSHNHPMYATVSGWLSKYIGGIRCSEARPGFSEVVVRPHVPRALGWAEAVLETVRGPVHSQWSRLEGGRTEYRVTVPASSTARLEIPGGGEDGHGEGRVLDAGGLGAPEHRNGTWGDRFLWKVGGGEHAITVGR
jgi:alpha-L-rhamnosidase